MRGYPGAEARERGLKEGTGDLHIPSAASPRDPTSLQLPGPQRPGWRVLSIPARAACHHAWRSVTRSTSSAPGKGGLAASLQPWKFPGGARNRGDSNRGHAGMRGSSQGRTGQPGASPWIPRCVLCAGGVDTARLREGAEIQHRRRYDAGKDGFIDLMELKLMMEKLGAPQTHLGLKNMIKEVDEDLDSKLSFREFLLIFRKAAAGELQEDSGLHALARLSEIDVSTEGVKGAKNFFEAKAQAINEASRFEEEIKAEQEEKKKQAEELKQRKAAFKELQSTFTQ
ncbi:uncharacterized protein LOC129129803 isoform X12 [Agelaius phoeniceus]|uniref:uncharacterized protein LOC129129803 isoform X12 n=1 Tax=Agelaius phoeniceus TaxID=39638 RepID=UPI004054A680